MKTGPQTPIEHLTHMALHYKCKKSPSVPFHAVPKPTYSETDTNSLTECVRDYLKMRGHFVARTNTQGQWRGDLKRWVTSGSTKGQADLNVIVNGRSWQIEIKYGKDRLRPEQEEIRDQVQQAGGIYIVVRSFSAFIAEYQLITQTPADKLWDFTLTENNKPKQTQLL